MADMQVKNCDHIFTKLKFDVVMDYRNFLTKVELRFRYVNENVLITFSAIYKFSLSQRYPYNVHTISFLPDAYTP